VRTNTCPLCKHGGQFGPSLQGIVTLSADSILSAFSRAAGIAWVTANQQDLPLPAPALSATRADQRPLRFAAPSLYASTSRKPESTPSSSSLQSASTSRTWSRLLPTKQRATSWPCSGHTTPAQMTRGGPSSMKSLAPKETSSSQMGSRASRCIRSVRRTEPWRSRPSAKPSPTARPSIRDPASASASTCSRFPKAVSLSRGQGQPDRLKPSSSP